MLVFLSQATDRATADRWVAFDLVAGAPRGQHRRGSQADTRRGRADVPGVWGTIKRGADNLSANLWDLPRPDDPGNSVRCGLEEDRRRDAIAFEVLGCQRRRAPDPQRGTLRRYARTANLRPRSDRLVGHPDRVYLVCLDRQLRTAAENVGFTVIP
jgi:hypothetical protein